MVDHINAVGRSAVSTMTLVYGVELADIPEGATPIEAIVILKALDEDGDVCLYRRASEGLAPWDQIETERTT